MPVFSEDFNCICLLSIQIQMTALLGIASWWQNYFKVCAIYCHFWCFLHTRLRSNWYSQIWHQINLDIFQNHKISTQIDFQKLCSPVDFKIIIKFTLELFTWKLCAPNEKCTVISSWLNYLVLKQTEQKLTDISKDGWILIYLIFARKARVKSCRSFPKIMCTHGTQAPRTRMLFTCCSNELKYCKLFSCRTYMLLRNVSIGWFLICTEK
jgi:hypothetical protein